MRLARDPSTLHLPPTAAHSPTTLAPHPPNHPPPQAYEDGLLTSEALHRVCIAAAADFRRVWARYGERHAGRNLGKALKHLNAGGCVGWSGWEWLEWGRGSRGSASCPCTSVVAAASPCTCRTWPALMVPGSHAPCRLLDACCRPPPACPLPSPPPADLRAANYVLPPRLQVPPLAIPGLAEGESLKGSRLPPPSPARSEALSDMSGFGFGQAVLS